MHKQIKTILYFFFFHQIRFQNWNYFLQPSADGELRSVTAWGKKLLSSLVVPRVHADMFHHRQIFFFLTIEAIRITKNHSSLYLL